MKKSNRHVCVRNSECTREGILKKEVTKKETGSTKV